MAICEAELTVYADDVPHQWVEVQFVFGSWLECTCGERPESQAEMDTHMQEVEMM